MKLQSNPFIRPALFVAALSFVLSAIPAHALDYFWEGGTEDIAGTGDAVSAGGSGTWDTTIKNWDIAPAGTEYGAWPTAANAHQAYFGGVGGTVTFGVNLGATGFYPNTVRATAGNYIFDQAGFDLSFRGSGIVVSSGATLDITSGTVTLQNNGNMNVTGANALKIQSKISGPSGVTVLKLGGGDLILSNDTNDFLGDLVGQNGLGLYITSIKNSGVASAAGAGSIVSNGENNTIYYTGAGDSTDRTFRIFGGGSDTLKNNGGGALVWTGAFTNDKTIATSTLSFGGTNTADNDFQGNLANNGTNTLTVSKIDAGTWKLSGANTYTGTTTISAGILQANRADVAGVSGALGNGGNISFAGGTLQYSAASAGTNYSTRIINNTTAAIKIDTNGQNVTFGTALAATNTAGLTKEGAGQLELKMSAAAQYTGTTTINGGILKFAAVADLDGISSSNININNGASLVIYSDFNRTTLSNGKTFTFGNTGGGSVVYDKGNHLWQTSTAKFVTTGGTQNTISAANGGFINPQGAHTVNFDVADGTDAIDLLVSVTIGNGNYTKSGAGTMSITSFSNLGGGTAQPNLTINAGTFDVGGTARLTTSGQSTGVVTSNILNNGVYRHSSSGAQTLSGVISGTGALTQNGSGTLTLTGNNSYSGATTVNAGADLRIDGAQTGAGTVTVAATGKLGGSGSVIGGINVSGVLAPGNSIGSLGGGALNFATGSTYAYELSTLGLNGDLTYSSGTLSIAAGTILTLTDLATSTALANGSKLTLISSVGAWNGGLFSYDAGAGLATLADDSDFILGLNTWKINYNDTLAGSNFTSDTTGATNFVTLTVVPEPNVAALLGGLGMLALLRRRR